MCQGVRLDAGRIKEQKILFLDPVCFTVGCIAFGTVVTALPECCEFLSLNAVPRVPPYPRGTAPLNVCGVVSSWSHFLTLCQHFLQHPYLVELYPGLGEAGKYAVGTSLLMVVFMRLQ